MRTSSFVGSALALIAAVAAGPAIAFQADLSSMAMQIPASETSDSSSLRAIPLSVQSSPTPVMPSMGLGTMPEVPALGDKTTADEAFNMARNLYRRGEKQEAINAFQFAAGQGHVGAQWMIARMYAKGDGVAHDDLKAFEYFRDIVSKAGSDFDDTLESRQNAAYVSLALLQLGSYYREGIPGTYVKQDSHLAVSLFSRAAYNYGEPNAQYNLAVMYVEGNGVPKDLTRAVQLFHNAAKKGHGPSRARLGHMIFKGEGVKRRPELGLMWMNLARQSAEQSGEAEAQWMIDLHEKALAEASEDERKGALGFLDRWLNN